MPKESATEKGAWIRNRGVIGGSLIGAAALVLASLVGLLGSRDPKTSTTSTTSTTGNGPAISIQDSPAARVQLSGEIETTPASRMTTITLVLGDEKLDVDFQVDIWAPGIDPISLKHGKRGIATFQRPATTDNVNVKVICPSHEMAQQGPFRIEEDQIQVPMRLATESTNLMLPNPLRYLNLCPNEALEIPFDKLETDVTFFYKNATQRQLVLCVYDASQHVHMENGDPIGSAQWSSYELPPSARFDFKEDFGEGAFLLFVEDRSNESRYTFLGCRHVAKNLNNTIVVREDTDGRLVGEFKDEPPERL